MSFRPDGSWNQPEQHAAHNRFPHHQGSHPRAMQQNDFQNSRQPWPPPAPSNHALPNHVSFAASSALNPMNTAHLSTPPPSNFQAFPPLGPPPPIQGSFSNPPTSLPPPPFNQPNSTFRGPAQQGFHYGPPTQVGAPPMMPNAQAYPPGGSFSGPPPPFSRPVAPFAQPQYQVNPPSFSQMCPPSLPPAPKPFQVKAEQQTLPGDKTIGEQKLEQWLRSSRKPKKPDRKKEQSDGDSHNPVQLWDFLNHVREMQELVSSLSCQVTTLTTQASSTEESAWEDTKQKCDAMKERLCADFGSLLDDGHLQEVQKKLSKVRHKRARLKRSRAEKFEERQLREQSRAEKSRNIDAWQETLRAKLREEEKEKKRKAAADRTLSKVTREIHDSTRLIDTMLALEKLRLIRRDAAQKRGDNDVGESRQLFEQKIKDMMRLVGGQLHCYREEEAKLKQVLKSEEEEKRKLERQDKEEQAKQHREEEDKKLRAVLFGSDEPVSPADPLVPFQQYYRQAEHSLPAFLQVRQEWDSFLVPKGTPASSTIPSLWVSPDPPSSSGWASAMQ